MSPSDKELNLISQLKDSVYFRNRNNRPKSGDWFCSISTGKCYRSIWFLLFKELVWFPNSDDLHELIRELDYEFGNVVEREPSGIIKIQLVNYKAPKDRKAYTNPFTHMAECSGKTMREALLSGLLKIINEGVY